MAENKGNGARDGIIGRGRRQGRQLLLDHFAKLNETTETGAPVCYVFVMGSGMEILESLGYVSMFPEVTSLQLAVRHDSMEYITAAEDYGYSPDVCGYIKCDVGLHLKERKHSLGGIPKPTLALATNLCNTYIKWAEIWQRMYDTPVFVLDFPGMRGCGWQSNPGEDDFERDRRYLQHQLEDFAELAARLSGRKFSLDKLVEVEDRVNRMAGSYYQLLQLNKNRPAPVNCMGDGLTYQGMSNLLRGTDTGVRYFAELVEEMTEKIRRGIGAVPDEKFRLLNVGGMCWPALQRWIELFTDWNANFVYAEYNAFAGGGFDKKGFRYDTSRPMESLAEQLLLSGQRSFSNMFFSHDEMADRAEEFHADGITYQAVKSCRTVSTQLADCRRHVTEVRKIPALGLEMDMVDMRVWSEAQIRNRIDAFFESLAARKAEAQV